MTLRRRLLAAVAALGLVATACSQAVSGNPQAATGTAPNSSAGASPPAAPSTAPTPAAPQPAPIQFRDCTTSLIKAGVPVPATLKGKVEFGCGQLSVPLDYAHPSGGRITVFVVRIHDTDNTNPIGSLLTNPGGPGVSGYLFALGLLSEIPQSVIKKFDLIGFDPRGVGLSNQIACTTDKQKDVLYNQAPDATTSAGFSEAQAEAKRFANACLTKYGTSLRYYNTENTARDMDQIRRALGEDQMNYLGFSYGTELGWVYAHLFPSTTRAIVLDGAVDPDVTSVAFSGIQVQGFEKAFDQFAAYCKTATPCKQLSDPREAVEQITARARANPIATKSNRKLTENLAYTGVLQALYSKSSWPRLATGLITATNGDGTGLLALADEYNQRFANGRYANWQDPNTVINCNDSAPGPSDATIRSTAAQWAVKYPLFGRWSASELFTCQSWQPHRTITPRPNAPTAEKVLVVGNLHDPATPYRGAVDLTRDLGNAELLTWNGEGHTSYLGGSTCVNNYVNRYLLSLKVPPDDTVCPAR
ncbi:MAG TPA: alpha/beta hydrolase [Jatrophihabitantaceae bacterium]